ncbi:MAG: hypothetical protein NTZ28_04210, partial [Nitrospirae bacterium]|nr:hypothetical protein [Nitrospirota bacterium]
HTNWTFYPEKDLVPKPIAFAILSKDGEQIPSENLAAAAYQEFQKLADAELKWGAEQRRSCSCRLAYYSETTQPGIHLQ